MGKETESIIGKTVTIKDNENTRGYGGMIFMDGIIQEAKGEVLKLLVDIPFIPDLIPFECTLDDVEFKN